MIKILFSIAMVGLASCAATNQSDKACICIRQTTNDAIIAGNQLGEYDIAALCVESQEALAKLPLKEKTAILKCLDSAVNNSANKILFDENPKRDLPPIKDSKEIEQTIITYKNRFNSDQVVLDKSAYNFSKRTMTARLLVDKMERDIMTGDIVDNGSYFEVKGMLLEGDNLNKNLQIRLRMPIKAIGKINESTSYGEEEYNQIIEFSGMFSQFGRTLGGQYSLTFQVDKYKLVNKPEAGSQTTPQIASDTHDNKNETSIQPNSNTVGTVSIDKAYFYREPDLATKRKGYLIKGQSVTLGEIKNDFVYCTYESNGNKTEGWMRSVDIKN